MKRTVSALGLLVVLTAGPLILVSTVGGPFLPEIDFSAVANAMRGSELSPDPVIQGLGLIAWVIWAYLLAVTILRIVAVSTARRGNPFGDRLLSLTGRLTPSLIRKVVDVALSGSFVLSSFSLVSSSAAALTSRPEHFVVHTAIRSDAQTSAPAPAPASYIVRPGDTLWEIAERHLGSGFQWRQIYEVNKGKVFADGRTLKSPRLIRPGWTLVLPGMEDCVDGDSTAQPPVQVPAPIASAPPPAPEPAAVTSPSPHLEQESTRDGRDQAPVVQLPSGSVIAASFASGLLAAQGLSALRRRRARRALDRSDVSRENDFVIDLRRAVAHHTVSQLEAAALEVVSVWKTEFGTIPRIIAGTEAHESASFYLQKTESSTPTRSGSGRVRFVDEGSVVRAEVPRPFSPRLIREETPMVTGLLTPIGHRKNLAVHVSLLVSGGIAIVGTDAGSYAMQSVLSCAANAACEDLEIYLLGDLGALGPLQQLNHVRRFADWTQASEIVKHLQGELLARASAFLTQGNDDVWGYLSHDNDEIVPPILIVATEPPASMKPIVEAVATQASPLGGALVAVG